MTTPDRLTPTQKIERLRHEIAAAVCALGYIADDPCQPDQRQLLWETTERLASVMAETSDTGPALDGAA